jgi:fumarate hydratase class I
MMFTSSSTTTITTTLSRYYTLINNGKQLLLPTKLQNSTLLLQQTKRTFLAPSQPATATISSTNNNNPIKHINMGKYAVKQSDTPKPIPEFKYKYIFSPDPNKHKDIEYERLDEASKHVSLVDGPIPGQKLLKVGSQALTLLSERANMDVAHLLRSSHLKQLSSILADPEASDNDKFVALQLLKNSVVAAGFVLPSCQDTGTAIVLGKKGHLVFTEGKDEESLSRGVYNVYTTANLRYSQLAPITMYEEKNTGTNLPAQIDIIATGEGLKYGFMFMQKGGGSANKTFLFQKTKSLLSPEAMAKFIETEVKSLGTAACPPYHLALVIGGLSAEQTLKTVKLASTRYLDDLPTKGDVNTAGAFRDVEMEQQILAMTRKMGTGAQWGGKYFCHDVRVIRLPRHGASCPVGLGVSCSADRQILGKITPEGVFLEKLERDPAKFLPQVDESKLVGKVVSIDMNKGMSHVLEVLRQQPIKTKISLTGTLIVARDIAHARLSEQLQKTGKLPSYFSDYPIYYAGPAKTPKGMASGSFGPTTASRMDSYLEQFQSHGASLVTLAKGNRSPSVTRTCAKHGGFYLCSIGGPAALLASDSIKNVQVLDMEELGMEAVWKIDVENFPCFIAINHKGEDVFAEWLS